MGGMNNIFNGGQSQAYGDVISELEQAIGVTNQNYKPYMDAGSSAIPQFQDFLKNLQSQMNGNWMNSYQESPYAKYLTGKETNAANNAAAAGGLLGSGSNQQANMTLANNITAGDMQNYFNNMQSQNQMYGGGLESLMGMGLNATNSDTQLVDNLMGNIGNAQGQKDIADQSAKNSQIGYIGDLVGLPVNTIPGGPGSQQFMGSMGSMGGGKGKSGGAGGAMAGGGSAGGAGGGGASGGSGGFDMSSLMQYLPLLMMLL